MGKKREPSSKNEPIAVRLQYEFPANLAVSSFANHMLVQRDEHDFHISFFQVTPPLIVGSDAERQELVAKMGPVPAKCVARVVVAEGQMQRIIDVLQSTLEKTKKPLEKNGQDKAHDKTA